MPESSREIDLDPRKYIGLSFPLRRDTTSDFALTKNSLQQAEHNLRNLLLTHPGERLNQPEFGCTLRALCFLLGIVNENDVHAYNISTGNIIYVPWISLKTNILV